MSSVRHPIFARVFDRLSEREERLGQAEHRREMLTGLSGRVVELGAGNGINFRHYPRTVTELVAVEPEPYLRERAVEAASNAPVPVNVMDGFACGCHPNRDAAGQSSAPVSKSSPAAASPSSPVSSARLSRPAFSAWRVDRAPGLERQ